MQYFPISLDINNRSCIVIGGGRVAARKVRSLLASGGEVTVISPVLDPELTALAHDGSINWRKRGYEKGDLARAFLVIAATDDVTVQEAVYHEAEENNVLLNVADVPKWCNFILPATVRRGELTLSVSTAGRSPALARRLRQELEEQYDSAYDILIRILGRLRPIVLDRGFEHSQNKIIFENLLHRDMIDWIRQKNLSRLNQHIRSILGMDISFDDLFDPVPPNQETQS